MKTDARSLFVFSLLVFAGITTWQAFDIFRSINKPDDSPVISNSNEQPFVAAGYKPLGLLDFVNDQFTPETLIVPVNPFHPTFDEIVKSLFKQSKSGVIELIDKDGNKVPVHFKGSTLVDANDNPVDTPFQRKNAATAAGGNDPAGGNKTAAAIAAAREKQKATQNKPKPLIAYRGIMQRPDGRFAAYISDSLGGSRFVVAGDRVRNATVTSSSRDGVELKDDEGKLYFIGPNTPPIQLENTGN